MFVFLTQPEAKSGISIFQIYPEPLDKGTLQTCAGGGPEGRVADAASARRIRLGARPGYGGGWSEWVEVAWSKMKS